MPVTRTLPERTRAAFSLPSEHARRQALFELLAELNLTPHASGPGIEALIDGMRREDSSLVLSSIWGRLSEHANEAIRKYAEAELTSPDGLRRSYAVYYLGHAYPDERRALFERMKRDADPTVLHEVGRLVMNEDPRAAVDVWRRAMYDAHWGLADETLAYLVGQYADDEVIAELRQAAQNPLDDLARVALWQASKWNAVDYLDTPGRVPPGPGYTIRCPSCGTAIAVRSGHAGERARCHNCGQTFVIPPESAGAPGGELP